MQKWLFEQCCEKILQYHQCWMSTEHDLKPKAKSERKTKETKHPRNEIK